MDGSGFGNGSSFGVPGGGQGFRPPGGHGFPGYGAPMGQSFQVQQQEGTGGGFQGNLQMASQGAGGSHGPFQSGQFHNLGVNPMSGNGMMGFHQNQFGGGVASNFQGPSFTSQVPGQAAAHIGGDQRQLGMNQGGLQQNGGAFNPGYGGRQQGTGRGILKSYGRGRDRGRGRYGAGREGQFRHQQSGTGRGGQALQNFPGGRQQINVPAGVGHQEQAPQAMIPNAHSSGVDVGAATGDKPGNPQMPEKSKAQKIDQNTKDTPSSSIELNQQHSLKSSSLSEKAKGKLPAPESQESKPSKKSKIYCHKCCLKGHTTTECVEILFCQICKGDDHVAAKCPLKKNRPVAHMVGYGADNLGFFYIAHGPFPMGKKESTTALVKVTGGSLTEEQLIEHLQRLVPGRFQWDAQLLAENMWIVPFPSKAELDRTINFGSADLKDGKLLKFEEFSEEENFGEEIPSVWMRVTNLPRVLRKYEVLWATGTMFGATQKVDMITTRRSEFGRFQVGVLDAAAVPTQMDVVIGKRYFELKFVIEPKQAAVNTSTKGNSTGDKSDDAKKDGKDSGNRDSSGRQNSSERNTSGVPNLQQQFDKSGDRMMEEVEGHLEDVSDFNPSDDDLLDDVGDDWGQLEEHMSINHVLSAGAFAGFEGGGQAEEPMATSPADKGAKAPMVGNLFPDADEVLAEEPLTAPLLERALAGIRHDEALASNGPAKDFGGLTTPLLESKAGKLLTPMRRSTRRAALVDEDSVERAARIAAKRNLEIDEGTF